LELDLQSSNSFSLKNSIKSLKFIYSIGRYNPDNYDYSSIKITDDFYNGPNSNEIPLKILNRVGKTDASTIILFPGASPDAEKHKGMIFLGSIMCSLGYRIIIPRINPLMELKINEDCFDWFACAYDEILNRTDVNQNNVSAMAMSFGGAVLLKASFDSRVSKNPPKSIMTFGTYSDIYSTLKFLCDGKIELENNSYRIKPHSWGLTVLFHNFLDKFNFKEIENYKNEIKQIINHQIQDNHDDVEKLINKLPQKSAQKFIKNILTCNIDDSIQKEILRVINEEKEFIKIMSPIYWEKVVGPKTFIMHGSNDSMVPFTESINLSKKIKGSSLFISYMYEHKEISTNKGWIFKFKEFYKMYNFFRKYLKYNDSI